MWVLERDLQIDCVFALGYLPCIKKARRCGVSCANSEFAGFMLEALHALSKSNVFVRVRDLSFQDSHVLLQSLTKLESLLKGKLESSCLGTCKSALLPEHLQRAPSSVHSHVRCRLSCQERRAARAPGAAATNAQKSPPCPKLIFCVSVVLCVCVCVCACAPVRVRAPVPVRVR